LTGTKYELSFLLSSITYYWRVRAESASSQSAWSEAWRFMTHAKTFVVPAIGSWFQFERYNIDSLGVRRETETIRITFAQHGATALGRSNLTTTYTENFLEPSYHQQLSNGDVAIFDDGWIDLPFGSGIGYSRLIRDSVWSSFVDVTVEKPISLVIKGTPHEARVVRFVKTNKSKSDPPDEWVEETTLYWIIDLGFIGKMEIRPLSGNFRDPTNIEIVDFEVK
jgi:hypothetical protein